MIPRYNSPDEISTRAGPVFTFKPAPRCGGRRRPFKYQNGGIPAAGKYGEKAIGLLGELFLPNGAGLELTSPKPRLPLKTSSNVDISAAGFP